MENRRAFKKVFGAVLPVLGLFGMLGVSGCGYSWQSRENIWREWGVRTVYIKMLTNSTLQSGVEVPFTSALVREFSRGDRLRVVSNEKEADAILDGTVTLANSSANASTTVDQISTDPRAKELSDFVIASDYLASASISVNLVRKADQKMLWSTAVSRSKVYPGNNRFGLEGVTSALINSSQEALALEEMAAAMAGDVHDAIFEAF